MSSRCRFCRMGISSTYRMLIFKNQLMKKQTSMGWMRILLSRQKPNNIRSEKSDRWAHMSGTRGRITKTLLALNFHHWTATLITSFIWTSHQILESSQILTLFPILTLRLCQREETISETRTALHRSIRDDSKQESSTRAHKTSTSKSKLYSESPNQSSRRGTST